MRVLVTHTSHLTQPLDVGVFGRCKNLIRSNSSLSINLQNIDGAVRDEAAAEREGREPSTEPGKKLAEFIVCILQAFHQATARSLVVSAFDQVGICSRPSRGNNPPARESFVDPTRARLVVDETVLGQLAHDLLAQNTFSFDRVLFVNFWYSGFPHLVRHPTVPLFKILCFEKQCRTFKRFSTNTSLNVPELFRDSA